MKDLLLVIGVIGGGSLSGQVLPNSVALKSAEVVALAKSNADSSEFIRDSGVLVLNFWATWCRPCVKELPYFKHADSALQANGRVGKTKFMFFSFDIDSGALERSTAMLFKKGIPGYWFWVDETDYNDLINGVDSSWQGDIPYTIIISGKRGVERVYRDWHSAEELTAHIEEHHYNKKDTP